MLLLRDSVFVFLKSVLFHYAIQETNNKKKFHVMFCAIGYRFSVDGLCLWTTKCGYSRTKISSYTTNWRRVDCFCFRD
jgi:hypothetical protein